MTAAAAAAWERLGLIGATSTIYGIADQKVKVLQTLSPGLACHSLTHSLTLCKKIKLGCSLKVTMRSARRYKKELKGLVVVMTSTHTHTLTNMQPFMYSTK